MSKGITQEQAEALAAEFVREQVQDFEFLTLAEDERTSALSEEDQEMVCDLIRSSKIRLSWPEA